MISIIVVLEILIIHWIADFVMQDVEWSNEKSKDFTALIKHTLTYSVVWFILGYIMFPVGILSMLLFTLTTFVIHTGTDYFTSRVVKEKFDKEEYGTNVPNTGAFTIIAFDQILHYIQLFLTYLIFLA